MKDEEIIETAKIFAYFALAFLIVILGSVLTRVISEWLFGDDEDGGGWEEIRPNGNGGGDHAHEIVREVIKA